MGNKHLFLFTISPVQSFISQARKTRDLYTSSRILCDLIKAGMNAFGDQENIIYPNYADDSESLPNRFVAVVEGEHQKLAAIANKVTEAVRMEWKEIAAKALNKQRLKAPNGFNAQIEAHLDINWVFHPLSEDYGASYKTAEAALGGVKNTRTFEQYSYNGTLGEKGRKCSLDGERNALIFGHKQPSRVNLKSQKDNSETLINYSLEKGEGLSAISFVKRFYPLKGSFPSTAEIALLEDIKRLKDSGDQKALNDFRMFESYFRVEGYDFDEQLYFEENLNATYFKKHGLDQLIPNLSSITNAYLGFKSHLKTKYYAIVLFDGDKMGDFLAKNADLDFHKNFSARLSQFAGVAKRYIDESGYGRTVYAGGDDFLGFLNLHYLFEAMQTLRTKFDEMINQDMPASEKLTFSAGIAIAHYKIPLSEVLKTVRKAEKTAKNKYKGDRNAFCVTALKHSGETQTTFLKWGANNSHWIGMGEIVKQLSGKNAPFSVKFIQNFSLELYQLGGVGGNYQNEQITICEMKRLIQRSANKGTTKGEIEALQNTVKMLWSASGTSKNFIQFLQIADFISRRTS